MMKAANKASLIRIIATILIITLITPSTAMAATTDAIQPYASKYLTSYNTYICRVGTNGQIQIWFDVMGTGTMDEIGVLSIELYEVDSNGNETWLKTYQHEDYSSMLIKNDFCHSSYVSYQGSTSKTYKAYVCIWAGKDGGGDTRYMWATMV